MRILFVADDYPPLETGGYAQLCQDLAAELRRRGHTVSVLAAKVAVSDAIRDEDNVYRRLWIPISFTDRFPVPVQQVLFQGRRHALNRRIFGETLASADPEVVVFWPSGYVDPGLMQSSESNNKLVTAYYLAGVTPNQPSVLRQYWDFAGHSMVVRAAKSLLRSWLGRDSRLDPSLVMRHVLCVSEYERQRAISFGLVPENAVVVNNGIDLMQFPFRGLPSTHRDPRKGLRVLYAGRLVATKGAHTAVEAFKWLRINHPNMNATLTLLGAGPDNYVKSLTQQIALDGLAENVTLRDWIPRQQVPGFMADFDVLVLPTLHAEPLARVVQEAMALGLNVVATSTGGTPELVVHGETGMLFAAGDAVDLGTCLLSLNSDSALSDRLAIAAMQTIADKYTIQVMGARVEEHLIAWQPCEAMKLRTKP